MRNKKLAATLGLLVCGTILVTGCQKKDVSDNSVKNTSSTTTIESSTEESTSKEEASSSSEKETSEKNTQSETTTAPGNTSATAISLPADANSMVLSAHALALCESETGLTYSSDNNYFWNATAYLLAGYGIQSAAADVDDEGILSLKSSIVKEFAASLFASYDGNNAPLPDIPADTTIISYDSASDCYKVAMGGFSSTVPEFSDCYDNNDGTISFNVDLKVADTDGELIDTWKITIKPTTYSGSGHPLFNYSVVDFKKI